MLMISNLNLMREPRREYGSGLHADVSPVSGQQVTAAGYEGFFEPTAVLDR
jgi:hypothetical protein